MNGVFVKGRPGQRQAQGWSLERGYDESCACWIQQVLAPNRIVVIIDYSHKIPYLFSLPFGESPSSC